MGYVTKDFDREQLNFMPLSFDELIDENNPVRVIEAFVEMLDMKHLGCSYAAPSKTGRPPYNPKDMMKLYYDKAGSTITITGTVM